MELTINGHVFRCDKIEIGIVPWEASLVALLLPTNSDITIATRRYDFKVQTPMFSWVIDSFEFDSNELFVFVFAKANNERV